MSKVDGHVTELMDDSTRAQYGSNFKVAKKDLEELV